MIVLKNYLAGSVSLGMFRRSHADLLTERKSSPFHLDRQSPFAVAESVTEQIRFLSTAASGQCRHVNRFTALLVFKRFNAGPPGKS